MSAHPVCRACDSANVILRGRKQGAFIKRTFEFYCCRDCELLFVEPFSGFEIYNDAYYRGQGPDPYVDYDMEYREWRDTERRFEFGDLARIADEIYDHAERNPSPVQWLDFGCGAGGFLKFLRERGSVAGRPVELTGHDIGSYANLLRDVDGFRILNLQMLNDVPNEAYDVVSMIEVIEHLPKPAEALALAARLLKPGGLLLLTTGNLSSPIARLSGIRHHYCAPEIHVSLFNPRCLARLYGQMGLTPIQVRYNGAVQFKVLKTLRHKPALRRIAGAVLRLPWCVQLIDALYGVSAMPCAMKPTWASTSAPSRASVQISVRARSDQTP